MKKRDAERAEAAAPLTVRCVDPCRGMASRTRSSWAHAKRGDGQPIVFPIYACSACGRRVLSTETAALIGTLTGLNVSRVWPQKPN